MKRSPLVVVALFAAVGSLLGGCSTAPTAGAQIDQPLPASIELAMAGDQPSFGVGDELGWLAFGDLALAPQPGEPRNVLVIARAEPKDDESFASFDWVGTHLALAE